MIIEYIEPNWLCKHMRRVRSSQEALLVLNWVKHSFSLWVSLTRWNDLVYFATRVPEKSKKSDTNAIRVRHEWHECYTSNKSASRVKNLDFDITTPVKTNFHTKYISYKANERFQREEQFRSRTTFWKCLVPMPKCVWKVHQKGWTL